jgi:alpha-tubulin suppressor-like RCC1 family protein
MICGRRLAFYALFLSALLLLTASQSRATAGCTTNAGVVTCTGGESTSIPGNQAYNPGTGNGNSGVALPPGNTTNYAIYQTGSTYPSTLTVSGLTGTIATIQVQLEGLTSDSTNGGCGTQNLEVLLEAPDGTTYMEVMGNAGDCGANTSQGSPGAEIWSNGGVMLTIEDAQAHMPYSGDTSCANMSNTGWPFENESGNFNEGNFAPTSCPFGNNSDVYPSPGPGTIPIPAAPSDSSVLSAPVGSGTLNGTFGGLTPNGTWKLYLVDDAGYNASYDTLAISGWNLIFTLNTTLTSTTTSLSPSINPSFTSGANSSVTLTATVSPAPGGGTVTFKDGSNTISCGGGNQTVNGSGEATCITTFSPQGNHVVTAVFNGYGSYAGSPSPDLNQFVETPTTGSFCNAGGITMPGVDNTSPYPSVINVTGITNAVATVSLSLTGFSWTESALGVHMLLVSPDDKALEFFSAGESASGNYTFTDDGAQVPENGDPIPAGSYQPTVFSISGMTDVFTPQPPISAPQVPASFNVAAPAGNPNAGTFETTFNGATANGPWSLFVYDDAGPGASGSITGGWCIDITQASGAATTTTVAATPNPALISSGVTSVTVTATVKSGGNPVSAGTVTFTENGANVVGGPTSPVAVNGSGQASFTTTSLPEGDHKIVATYSGVSSTYALSFGNVTQRVDSSTAVTLSDGVLTFCNPGKITIPNPNNSIDEGAATPNPSNIFVANTPGTINHVSVTLNGVELSTPYFLTSLLVGPLDTAANSFDFFSDVGGATPMSSPVNLVLDDNASAPLSTGNAGAPLIAGTFKPTSGPLGGLRGSGDTFSSTDSFYSPPAGPYNYAATAGSSTFASIYQDLNPNGTWSLYLNQYDEATGSSIASWCVNITPTLVTLGVVESHTGSGPSGDFEQGEQGASLTTVITNNGTGPTGDPTGTKPLTVKDFLASDFTPGTLPTGTPWNCSASGQTVTCTNDSSIAQGDAYPTLTIPVNVSSSAAASDTNNVSLSGSGTGHALSGTDTITIITPPLLAVTKSHTGTFTQGSTAQWSIVVSNIATGTTTSGTVMVADTLPTGYTVNAASGTNWSCSGTGTNTLACSNSETVEGGSSFPTITLTVKVPTNSATSVSNTAAAYGGGDILHSTLGTAATGVDNDVPVVQVPALIAINGSSTQSATIGMAFGSLAVTVKDAGGVAIPNYPSVTFTATTGTNGQSGTFSNSTGTTTLSASMSGVADPGVFTANSTVGSYTVGVTAGSATTTFNLTNTAGLAANIVATSGGGQSATAGSPFTNALTVTVTDSGSNPVSGATVTFTPPATGASITFAGGINTAVTGMNGVATSAAITANTIAGGPYSVTATSNSVTASPGFSLTNTVGPVASIADYGFVQTATVGGAFAAPLQAVVGDQYGNPVGSGVSVTFTVPAGGASGTFTGNVTTDTEVTGSNGVATTSLTYTANSVAGFDPVTATTAGVTIPALIALYNQPAGSNPVAAWGNNSAGQLGNNSTTNSSTPVQVEGSNGIGTLTGVVAVAAGYEHSLTLNSDGSVSAWGYNADGELGNNSTANSGTPVTVAGSGGRGELNQVVAVAAGAYHSLALSNQGTVWAWGSNNEGQLGDPSAPQPGKLRVQVLGPGGNGSLNGIVAIAGGYEHSLALRYDGTVWAWGYNGDGELGNNSTTGSGWPVQVAGAGGTGFLTGVVAIAGGYYHSLALKSDGTVWAWGRNSFGELGNGTITSNNSTPVQVSNLTGVVAIAGGQYHSLALKSDGTVWAWGWDFAGQLGDNSSSGGRSDTPVQVVGPNDSGDLIGIMAIAGGQNHSLALKNDGTVWAWGSNGDGELGNSATTNSSTPVQVSTLTGAAAIDGGGLHSLAVGTTSNTAGPATHFAVSVPSAATSGTSFNFTVTALDANNNVAIGYEGNVTFSSSDSSPLVVLPSSTTLSNGTGTFSATLITPGIQTISATDAQQGSVTGISGNVTVGGSATHFSVVAASPETAGSPFNFTVTALDVNGNVATSYAGTVKFSTSDSGALSAVPGNYTFLAGDDGVHTFTSGATLVTAPSQTITATDTVSGTITGTSSPITVNPTTATKLAVSATSPETAGSPFSVTVTAQDTYGNTATGYTGTVKFTTTDTGTGVTLPANYGFIAGNAGVHTFASGATLVTAGPQTITATDTAHATITGTSNTITVAAGGAAHIAVFSGSSQSQTVTLTFSNALVATVTDAHSNPVSGATVTFTPPSTGASITFAGGLNTAMTGLNGEATSAAITANTIAGGYMVGASVTGASTPAEFSLTNIPGAAATLTPTSGSGQSASVNTPFTNPLTATVTDAYTNVISGAPVTFTGPSTGAGIVTTQVFTNTNGVASATVTANGNVGGAYMVTAASGSASNTFSLTNLPGSPYVTGFALNSPSLRNNFGGWVGMQFTVGSTPLTVGTVGRICATGNSQTHVVKFVNASDGRIDVPGGGATVNMAGCTPGQFVYANLASSITLPAGGSYYLVSMENLNGDEWYDYGGNSAGIATTSAAAVTNAIWFDGVNWDPEGGANSSYVPPNFKYAVSPPPSTPAFVVNYNLSSEPLRNNFSGFVGMVFTVGSTPLNVTSLGRVCAAGNSATHTVKMVLASTGVDVPGGTASVNMAGCTAGQFVYSAPAGGPTTVQANTAYYVVSQETSGGDMWYDHGTLTTTSDAAVTNSVYFSGTWIAVDGPNTSYVPPNFQYSPLGVPPGAVQVTVQTSIAGPSFTVDGTLYNTPQVFTWVSGSPHTIATTDPQAFATGSRYHFTGWSDLGTLSHQVMPTVATTYTAGFVTQFLLTTSVAGGSGSILLNPTPPQGDGYYNSGTPVGLDASPSSGYAFFNWSGDLSGPANPQTLTMSQPHSATANFEAVAQASGFVTGFALNNPALRNNFGNLVGMKLTVGSNPLSVASVGRMCATGNSQTHLVEFVSITGGGVAVPGGSATVNMTGCTPGQFVYANLTSPVTLPAGATYYFVSQENLNGDKWYDIGGITDTGVATVTNSVYFDGATWNLTGGSNTAYVPPDFKYSVLPPASPQPYVIDFNLDNPPVRNNYTGFVGMKFTVGGSSLSVSTLGRICVAGNTHTHTVEVFTTAGADVGSVSVNMTGCTGGQFVYGTLTSPITLLANTTYYLVSQETSGGDSWYDHDSLITTTVAAENGSIYSSDGVNFFTGSGANTSYVPVNFQGTP